MARTAPSTKHALLMPFALALVPMISDVEPKMKPEPKSGLGPERELEPEWELDLEWEQEPAPLAQLVSALLLRVAYQLMTLWS